MCAKTFLYVPDGNGRRCAIGSTRFSRRELCCEWKRALGSDESVLDIPGIRNPCVIPLPRHADTLLFRHLWPNYVWLSHILRSR